MTRARELLALVEAGAVDGLSIGYRTVRGRIEPQTRVRKLYQVDLWEISIVTFPLLAGARVRVVKQATPPSAPGGGVAARQGRTTRGAARRGARADGGSTLMSHESAFEAAQRARWMRPDAYRWIRPDAARFLKSGTDPHDVFPSLARKYSPSQPRVPAGSGRESGRWTDGSGFSATQEQEDFNNDTLTQDILAAASNLRLTNSPADYRACVKLCYPLLERFSSPGSDKNYWDFQKCLNACLKRGL